MTIGSLEPVLSGDRLSRRIVGRGGEACGAVAAAPWYKNLDDDLDEEEIFDDEEGDDYGGLDDEFDEEFDDEFDEDDVDLDDEFEY